MQPLIVTSLLCLNIGRVKTLGQQGLMSGIDKRPVAGPIRLTRMGLAGDDQADRRHHGGPDKALHHYPAEHYECWRGDLPNRATLFVNGAFGENLSTQGLTEATVCLGDVWRLGGALLQVSQGRQPCHRLNLRFDLPDMIERVRATGRTGLYYRVLEEGMAAPGDDLVLLERIHPEWPLTRLTDTLFGRRRDRGALGTLAGLPLLSVSWRERAARRLIEAATT